jgi:hypothetical protein
MKIITTDVLLHLNQDAQQRNRAFNHEWLVANADPDGFHVIDQVLLHNDVEWRTKVLVKVKDTNQPASGFLDVSFENWNAVDKVDVLIREELDRTA